MIKFLISAFLLSLLGACASTGSREGASPLAKDADATLPEVKKQLKLKKMKPDPERLSICVERMNESSIKNCEAAYPNNADKKSECIMTQTEKNREICVNSDNQSSRGSEFEVDLKDGLDIKDIKDGLSIKY